MSGKTILLVDDEPDFVKMVKMRVEANGYEAVTAFDGVEGLKIAREVEPDLILLDVMMPRKDGYTVLRELKKDESTKNIPVIALTAKSGMDGLFDIEGVEYFVTKPFDADDLMAKIKKTIG